MWILEVKLMEKCMENAVNSIQMGSKWYPNATLEASKWAKRPQDGSRGARMVSMRLQEDLKDL